MPFVAARKYNSEKSTLPEPSRTPANRRAQKVVKLGSVEVCRSQNTTGWFIAIYSYKGFLLIVGVYMAWETRHVKIPSLNDSQYIGICVYSVVSSAIVVVLSNFLSDYTTLSYLATALSILVSTTITLLLLFLPKLRAVLGRVDGENAIVQSMGLKIESNTRRFMFEDHRELLYRMEVQNRVYKSELQILDKEIARLEELLMCSTSTSPKSESLAAKPFTISNGLFFLPVPLPGPSRASWPSTTRNCITPGGFLSENKLHNKSSHEYFVEKLKIFDKLKKFFGSIPSVWMSSSSARQEPFHGEVIVEEGVKDKPSSNPEFNMDFFNSGFDIVRAKSAMSALNSTHNRVSAFVSNLGESKTLPPVLYESEY